MQRSRLKQGLEDGVSLDCSTHTKDNYYMTGVEKARERVVGDEVRAWAETRPRITLGDTVRILDLL